MPPVLEVKDLIMDFGGLRALDAINLEVRKDEIVALIGPNGAGKTTFFNCITGIYEPTMGDMIINPPGRTSRRLNRLKPNAVTTHGLARTFQNIRLFQKMTVLENVMVARHCRTRSGILGAILRDRKTLREEREMVNYSYRMLEKVGLTEHVNELAHELPYGAQRRLEIARALATE
ncbi:ABC transporter ATP-binding protein, partial [bacterium]|nr:ABC transporter ATP-binding protein [bacterium]